jgi:putative hemolysin
MKPFSEKDLKTKPRLNIPEGTIITETLLHFFTYNNLNKVYSELHDKDPITLINCLLDKLDLKYDLPEEDMKNIPEEGGFITISNHPYRGLDSMLLFKLISEKRNDFKIMANYLLQNIEPLREIILPVNTFETSRKSGASLAGIKIAFNHVKNGHCLGIFPAGERSIYYEVSKIIIDKVWQSSSLKFIKNASVPVIPVYFHGTNSRLFHIIRKINPLLRSTRLPSELISKKNRMVKIRIGSPISVIEQSEFKDIAQYGRYLRARTYALGSRLEARKFFVPQQNGKKIKPEPVIAPVPPEILTDEFRKIRPEHELFSIKNYSVICAPTNKIPEIFSEIGRLRELTFRKVGEGTNKSSDIDEYDFYYYHMFVWDTDVNRIVGAYRIGRGNDIAAIYGLKGFYINSLFRIKKEFISLLRESLELGRSFIISDYQKKPMPLFLLWKGIMLYLLKNPEYRYLIGPVSMSSEFSKFSKNLIVEFVRTYFYDSDKARFIIPRKRFIIKPDKITDRKLFVEISDSDISKIEKIIVDIEPGYRIPVLLRKYLEINGKIIGFNIDPKFNDCLDGLLILDIYKTPPDFIRALSKELNDDSILERFRL